MITPPPLLRAKHLRGLPRREHRPAEIHREQQVQLLDRRESAAPAPGQDVGAGVVHPDVEAPERVAGRGADRADRLEVGEVELERQRSPSERADLALDFPRALLVLAIGDRDVGSRASGGERYRPADAARGAGHEHGAARERQRDRGGHERGLYDRLRNRVQQHDPQSDGTRRAPHEPVSWGRMRLQARPCRPRTDHREDGGWTDPARTARRNRDERRCGRVPDQRHQAIVATTDFFMPIVDDPFDFGAIAATNAISDVYAMGGSPLFALALVAMPVGKLPLDTIRRCSRGANRSADARRFPVAGGHSVDSVEPIYGLVAIGVVDPRHVKRNAAAKPGDKLVLGKALGVGVYGAAVKTEQITDAQYRELIATTTQLNTPGVAARASSGRPRADRCHRLWLARPPLGGV